MPKKTRRAKLIAEYRRKLQLLSTPHAAGTEPSVYTLPQQVTPTSIKNTVASSALPNEEFQSIRKDLLTTMGIVTLFFILEFGLWRVFG